MTEPTKEQIERARHVYAAICNAEPLSDHAVAYIARALAAARDEGWNAALEEVADCMQSTSRSAADSIRALKRPVQP